MCGPARLGLGSGIFGTQSWFRKFLVSEPNWRFERMPILACAQFLRTRDSDTRKRKRPRVGAAS